MRQGAHHLGFGSLLCGLSLGQTAFTSSSPSCLTLRAGKEPGLWWVELGFGLALWSHSYVFLGKSQNLSELQTFPV